ncbi:MAG: DUF4178 domain-containing protein, partial [Sphingobacteriales bacterium]
MEITCIKCNTVTRADVDFEVTQFACGHCKSLIRITDSGKEEFIRTYAYKPTFPFALKIGQKGTLEGADYVVTGIIVKKIDSVYFWREYILTTKTGEKAFLSETDGHWIFLKEAEEKVDVAGTPMFIDYGGREFKLYEYEDTQLAYAEGFFDYELPPGKQDMVEYINPPYIVSVEKQKGIQEAFYGHHISKGTVKKAFAANDMPYRSGVGIVRPFAIDLRFMVIIFSLFSILILTSHMFIYASRKQQNVLNQTLSFAEYSGKDFVSAPFTLEGGSAPLKVTVNSAVDNSWASVQVGLVNEVTNEEVYSGQDVEYYHGYEGGENWSEGSTGESFYMCGVPAGKYHLVITPNKPPEDLTNTGMQITATWNAPLKRNVFIPILIMGILCVATYYLRLQYERRRWADSNYSPYD